MTLLRSPHLSTADWGEHDERSFGTKVKGLREIPSAWTPPYFVIPTAYFDSWIRSGMHDDSAAEDVLPTEEMAQATAEVMDHWHRIRPSEGAFLEPDQNTEEVVVRSSARIEGLQSRGEFMSRVCRATPDEIRAAIYRIWQQAHERFDSDVDELVLGIVVQAKVPRSGMGHLSNERRVSRISTNWSIEWERGMRDEDETYRRFSTVDERPIDETEPLTPSSQDDVERALRGIAAWSMGKEHRSHFEWVWGGSTLWLVQFDSQRTTEKSAPGSRWQYPYPSDVSPKFHVLTGARESERDWEKTSCLEVFEKCDLYCPDIFVLSGDDFDSHRSDGTTTDVLDSDIRTLVEAPVVVRTDVTTGDDESIEVFSRRSDALTESEDVLSFLSDTFREFRERGYRPSEFCFLIHHFMVSKAAALARAAPNTSTVSIDSIWGLPDGLNYYPHDSFRVDIDHEDVEHRDIRCKDRYLDVGSDGTFIERSAGKPWDWKTTLSTSTVFSIAEKTRTIAEHEGNSIVVMFFVDLGIEDQRGESIPWVFWPAEEGTEDRSSAWRHWSTTTLRIRTEDDLSSLRQREDEISAKSDSFIEFEPAPEYVRDTEFIEAVADFADALDVPIQLHGSVLSHAHYILRRTDARVQTTYEYDSSSSSMRFSKLVRDKIPVMIESGGEITNTYEVPPEDIVDLLKAKAVEEALEFSHTNRSGDELEELADLLEIIRSYTEVVGSSIEDVKGIADSKREEKGGFTEGIVLVSTRDERAQQETLTNERNRKRPRLPTPFFPDPKVRDDLNPREITGRDAESLIEAPLIPPPLRGLEGSNEFQFPELDVTVTLEYDEDRLLISLGKDDRNSPSVDQSRLEEF